MRTHVPPARCSTPRSRSFPDPIRAAVWLAVAGSTSLALSASAASPSLQSDHDAYYPGEPIAFSFANGPGNSRDWIGVYPSEVVPGSVGSTIWNYVAGTQTAGAGLKEGAVQFPNGLALAGDWAAYFLLNDGYTALATNLLKVVEPGSPLVRASQRLYATGQRIEITFTNGPANAKDWVGVYKVGQTPGAVQSTIWNYVDGTQTGAAGRADGTVSFATGLGEAGEYVAHFLLNDGYDILASETFRVVVPTGSGPRLLAATPSDGSSNQPPVLTFTASITNGTAQVVASSVVLRLDGAVVPATVQQNDGLTTVKYTGDLLPAAGSTHVWSLTARDNAAPPAELATTVRTTVGAYRNISLPAPLFFENFDAVAEGELPSGWTGRSYTEITNPEEDLGNLDSATYARWTTVAADRFNGSFVTYSNPDGWETDYRRVLTPNPFNVVDGRVLTGPLATGRFLFGDSGYRNGRSQVLYVSTPDYNLTGKSNVHIAFKSLWEQNQDSMALVEYSIDQGASWLPVAYFIDAADLVTRTNETTGAVSLDVAETLGAERGDVARYTDESGSEVGGTYGSFVGATVDESIGAFVQGRINDDTSESKRVEFFPLPRADNQSKVRIRFGHAGTDSWYFGIDDFGVYSIQAAAPALSIVRTGNELVLSWAGSSSGVVLEHSPSLSSASWTAVSGVSGSQHRVTPSGAAGFYRLRQ